MMIPATAGCWSDSAVLDKRQRQQRQPGNRQDHGGLLAAREPGRVPPRGGERQDGDP